MTDEVRIQLEGRLETLEAAAATLEALCALAARPPRWELEAPKVCELLGRYLALAPRLPEAATAALARGERGVPARLADAQRALHRALSPYVTGELDAQLDAWLQLAEHTGVRHEGQPLASAAVPVGLPEWVFFAYCGVVAAALLLSPFSPALRSALGVAAAGFWFLWLQSALRGRATVTYRLFADALEVEERGAPTRALPLASVPPVDAKPGARLLGLRTIVLPSDAAVAPVCEALNALFAERAALARQDQALAAFAGEAVEGRWVSGTLLGAGREPNQALPGPVPVVKFGRARPSGAGTALVAARGLLFVAQSAEPEVRRVLFGAEVTLLRDQQRPLIAFPAGLLLEHLARLRELPGVVWLDAAEPLEWVVDGGQEYVTLPAGRLSLRLDEASRTRLRALWPSRAWR